MKRYISTVIVCFLCISGATHARGQKYAKVPSFEDYIRKYKDLAIQQQRDYKIPASITLAQGLLESAAGDSRLARLGNNHFGIKCKEEWRGGKMYHDDDAKNECFRTYASVEDSYLDHSLFLSKRKYYVSLFDLDLYDYKAWARGLQKCGYATDKSYGDKLIRIIETYELYKYDRAKLPERPPIIIDDVYDIKYDVPERPVENKSSSKYKNLRRHIYRVNGIHYVTVTEYDTYNSLVNDTHLKLKKLLKYNEITEDYPLREGDRIYLQSKQKYAAKGHLIHVVRAGESLHSISQFYGMKLQTLYKLNKLPSDYVIKPGDTLKLRKK